MMMIFLWRWWRGSETGMNVKTSLWSIDYYSGGVSRNRVKVTGFCSDSRYLDCSWFFCSRSCVCCDRLYYSQTTVEVLIYCDLFHLFPTLNAFPFDRRIVVVVVVVRGPYRSLAFLGHHHQKWNRSNQDPSTAIEVYQQVSTQFQFSLPTRHYI